MLKRSLDVIVSAAALVALAPLLLVLFVLVRRFLGAPAFYRQWRPGKDERLFRMAKFRSMTDERDADGNLLPDERRLTAFGRFLRSSSLDELPELWNVLKGEMSLVGPRPLMPEYLERYSPRQRIRHRVRPGVTGWAQVNGRNAIDWDSRLEMDAWYVEHHNLWLDLKILWMTLATVLLRRGVSAENHATMPPFLGSQSATSAGIQPVTDAGEIPASSTPRSTNT